MDIGQKLALYMPDFWRVPRVDCSGDARSASHAVLQ
jgi:hypothetical protein